MIIFYNVTSLYYKQHCPNVTRQQSIGKGRDRHNLATYPCGSVHVQYFKSSKISFICLAWPEICLESFSVIQQILFTGCFITTTVVKHISWFSIC